MQHWHAHVYYDKEHVWMLLPSNGELQDGAYGQQQQQHQRLGRHCAGSLHCLTKRQRAQFGTRQLMARLGVLALVCGCVLLLLLAAVPAAASDDYYDILGVKNDASDAQVRPWACYQRCQTLTRCTHTKIRQAYRKLAKKWHPDKHKDDETAHKKFQEIAEGE